MNIQKRIVQFVTRSNWVLFVIASVLGGLFLPVDFALGIVAGGLIVTINFHLLARTLKNALTPPHIASHTKIIAKYYVRFIVSGCILFLLISGQIVAPLGLIIGLSVVVVSIVLATLREVKILIFKEAC